MKWIGAYQKYETEYIEQRFRTAEVRPWKDADLTGSGVRHGETGQVWRGFDVRRRGVTGPIRHQNWTNWTNAA
jgi:hypothetical protein